jgi:hypothetical protein
VLHDTPNGVFDSVSDTWRRTNCWNPVVARALSLLGPGELRALRVHDVDTLRCALSATRQDRDPLSALCAVALFDPPQGEQDEFSAATVVERCAATITELKGSLPAGLLCQSDRWGHPPVLARCTQLEVLNHVLEYTPAVWLGLSQLHTLHDVDLTKVSIAAIAAALPRLHSVTAHRYIDRGANDSAAVAGFFTDLLPRLRVFRFCGNWSMASDEAVAPAAPLPLLEELEWCDDDDQPTLLHGFLGARPMLLSAPYELVVKCLSARSEGLASEPANGLLARARELHIVSTVAPVGIADVAHVLRAAPQLRNFSTGIHVHGDTTWLTASHAPLPHAFVDPVHPRLRCLDVSTASRDRPSSDEGCASRLRRTCFPRLRELTVNDFKYFVTPGVMSRHAQRVALVTVAHDRK